MAPFHYDLRSVEENYLSARPSMRNRRVRGEMLQLAHASGARVVQASCRQFVEQRLGIFQIERIEAFSEPAVDRSKQFASLLNLALITPEPRHAHRRAQLPGFCLLLPRD